MCGVESFLCGLPVRVVSDEKVLFEELVVRKLHVVAPRLIHEHAGRSRVSHWRHGRASIDNTAYVSIVTCTLLVYYFHSDITQ